MSGSELLDLLWGRLPRLLLTSGLVAGKYTDSKRDKGARTELLVLMGILSHCNERYESNPGMGTLARCADVSIEAARAAVRRLERRGIIVVLVRGGGRGRSHRYGLNPEVIDFLVSLDEGGSDGLPSFAADNRKSAASNPEACASKGESPGLPGKRVKEEKQQQGGAAAGGVCDEQGKPSPAAEHQKVAAVLDRVGLADTAARAEVAGVDGIELVIEELGGRAAKGDNPPGLLRKLVREDAPTAIEQARTKFAASAQREAAEASARQQREDEKKMRAEAEGRLNAMSEAEREALRAEVLAELPGGRLQPSEWLVREWLVDELVQRGGLTDKTSTRG